MSNLVKQENNSIQQWKPTSNNSIKTYEAINNGLLRISNDVITIATSHEACIIEDENQLSSMIVKSEDVVDKTNCYRLIELFVIEVFEWFGKDIPITLIQSLAKTIYQNYYWLRIAELKLFVEKIKAGNWKQIHGMSPAVLMERLGEFAGESMQIREDNAVRTADMQRSDERRDYERTLSERRKDAQAFHEVKVDLFKKNIEQQKQETNEQV